MSTTNTVEKYFYHQIHRILTDFYLLSSSNHKDSTKNKSLSQNISHEALLKGPQAVHPHPRTEECQQTHLPLTGSIKALLQRNA